VKNVSILLKKLSFCYKVLDIIPKIILFRFKISLALLGSGKFTPTMFGEK